MDIPYKIQQYMEHNPNTGRYKLAELFGISEAEARLICRQYKGVKKSSSKFKRGVAIGDIHYPYHNRETMNIFFDFIKDFDPDYIILAGDSLEMDSISFHNRGKATLLEGKRLSKDYAGFQKEILDTLDSLAKEGCEKHFIVGNHEYFVTRLLEETPQHQGFIEMENNLKLDDWHMTQFNDVLKIGNMYFIHGHYHNKYHSEKNVSVYSEQIFSWHLHTNQVYTKHSPITYLPRQGVSVGCACDRNPLYMRKRPNAWVNQFMFFYIFEDGTFSYFTPIIINGRTVINNIIYEG